MLLKIRLRLFVFAFIICLGFFARGQNLITNGDFETFSSLPTNYGDFCKVTGWINPSGCCLLNANYGTPDYINTNAAWPVGAPTNGFGTISPRSGNGAVGFTTYANYGSPVVFREYICKGLNSHLIIGQSYTVSFYVARAASPFFKYATNNIGVYFSTTAPVQIGAAVINIIPQWEYPTVFSSSTWTQFTFNIIPTDTFCYITIGNFRSDLATTKVTINSTAAGLYSHYFIDDVSVITASALPVELLSFDVQYENPKVKLTWLTASEKNNDYFTIERSDDLNLFNEISRIESFHNSNVVKSYSAFDDYPRVGISYYRLKQTDIDGSESYSAVKSISLKPGNEAEAWFEKYSEKIYVMIPSFQSKNTNLFLYDINGRPCYFQKTFTSEKDEINAGSFVRGIYTVILQDEKNVSVKKLVVY